MMPPYSDSDRHIPTADDVAIAIIAAARAYGEDPEEVATGVPGLESRAAALCALNIMFPQCRSALTVRMVGGHRTYLSTYNKGLSRAARMKRYTVQWQAAECVKQRTLYPKTEPIELRRPVVIGAENVTADLMGDPPPARSALGTLQLQCHDNVV